MSALYATHPLELLSPLRFDLCAKYFYGKYRKTQSTFPLELYAHHLKVWNNYSEYNDPAKQDLDSFVAAFHKILDSLEEGGFTTSLICRHSAAVCLMGPIERQPASCIIKRFIAKNPPLQRASLTVGTLFSEIGG